MGGDAELTGEGLEEMKSLGCFFFWSTRRVVFVYFFSHKS